MLTNSRKLQEQHRVYFGTVCVCPSCDWVYCTFFCSLWKILVRVYRVTVWLRNWGRELHPDFISEINQLDAQNFCLTVSFTSCLYMFRAHVLIISRSIFALHSLWYHHTETSEWSKTTKIQFYKYEQIAVKFMCEYFGCDYCVLLTVNMLCHVEVMFIQLLNLLERYYV